MIAKLAIRDGPFPACTASTRLANELLARDPSDLLVPATRAAQILGMSKSRYAFWHCYTFESCRLYARLDLLFAMAYKTPASLLGCFDLTKLFPIEVDQESGSPLYDILDVLEVNGWTEAKSLRHYTQNF